MRRPAAWLLLITPFVPGIAFALASLSVDPASLSFDTRCVRTRAEAKRVTVTNTDAPEATSVRVEVSPSPMATVFPLSGATETPSLGPDGSLSFDVGFVPQVRGTSTARAVVRYQAVPSPTEETPSPSPTPRATRVELSGNAVDRFIGVSPPAVGFGNVRVGKAADAARLTIFDDGDSPLSIAGITLDGRNASDFSIDEEGPATIRDGKPLRIAVGFKPARVGARAAELVIRSNSCRDATLRVQLAGVGVVPDAAVLPVDIGFGDVQVGERSNRKPITIVNQGGATLRVSGIELDGDAKADFTLGKLPSFPLSLGPQKSVEFLMRFVPKEEGTREAVLRVVSNDDDAEELERPIVGVGTIVKPSPSPSPTPTVVETRPPSEGGGFSFPIGRYVPELAVSGSVALFFWLLVWVRRVRGIPE